MTINIIIRVDDIKNQFDFYELKKWFKKHFPKIPVCFYACYTQYNYMWNKTGWKKIKRAIQKNNWEIGGHSRRHSHLDQIYKEELKYDIGDNVLDIENGLKSVNLNYKVTSFAYPYGDFNENVKNILKNYGIIHGLTYTNQNNYDSYIKISEDNLFEINVSCNFNNSIDDWNKRFSYAYQNGNIYILCLHTPHWSRSDKRKNFSRILFARSIKAKYKLLKYFFRYYKEENKSYYWKLLKQHIDFILKHKDIKFITFKQLLTK